MRRFLNPGGLLLAAIVATAAGSAPAMAGGPYGWEGFSGNRARGSAANSEPSLNNGKPAILDGVGIEQKLNAPVPLDLEFTDESGATVRLADYFQTGRPVVLSLAYFGCPMLCTQVLNGLTSGLKALTLEPARDFTVLTVSFDTTETHTLAAAKKLNYVKAYGRPAGEEGWHFLTGRAESVRRLTEAVGFHYAWDAETRQYAHASGVMVLTPQGHVSHYLFGMDFPPRDLRLALVEASQNKIGNLADQVLLYCYHYDPATGRYGAVTMNVLRLAGVATVALTGLAILIFLRRERRTRRLTEGTATPR